MLLKELSCIGFKSFAKKTTLSFHAGITAIVGPNGCGKSNIIDAFRWVMGEQSAKSIRGDKMLDVIFSGSQQRKALNFAEVTLTFTQVAKALPVDYEEVSICRRVWRNGESEFFINQRPVRLKDIEALFWDSGIGKNAFCIFEQGKIEHIILSSPLERRRIFEEAAGIGRFKERLKETQRRLEQVQNNLDRLQDIVCEVEKQKNHFGQQAQIAQRYRENQGILENLEKALYVVKWRQISERLQQLREKSQSVSSEKQEAEKACQCLNDEMQISKEQFLKLQASIKEQESALYQAKNEVSLSHAHGETAKAQMQEGKARLQKMQKELDDVRARRITALKEAASSTQSLESLEKKWSAAKSALAAAKKKQDDLLQQLQMLQLKQKESLDRHVALLSEKALLQKTLHESTGTLNRSTERAAHLREEIKRVEQKQQEEKRSLKDKQKSVQELSQSCQDLKQTLHAILQQVDKHRAEVVLAESKQKQAVALLTEYTARLRVLEKLKEEMEGLSLDTQHLLKASKEKKCPFYQKLHPLSEVLVQERDFHSSHAKALFFYEQTLVADTKEAAADVLHYARAKQLSDFSLICRQQAKELIACIRMLPSADEHWLRGAHQDLVLYVDQEGGWIDGQKVLFHSKRQEASTFLREAQIKEVGNERKRAEAAVAEIEAKIRELEEQTVVLSQRRNSADKELRRQEMCLVEANFHLQQSLSQQRAQSAEIKRIEGDIDVLDEDAVDRQKAIKAHEKAYRLLQQQEQQTQKELAVQEKKVEEKRLLFQEHACHLQHAEASFLQKDVDRQKLLQDQRVFEAREVENSRVESALEKSLQQQQQAIDALAARLEHLLQGWQEAKSSMDSIKAAYEEQEKKAQALQHDLSLQSKRHQSLQETWKRAEQSHHRLQLQEAEEAARINALEDQLLQHFGITIEQANKVGEPVACPVPALEQKIKNVRKLLVDAGDVNMASIEEFDKTSQRLSFLSSQMADMQAAKADLLRIMEQLTQESRGLFKEVLEKARQYFQKNFHILFQGGQADLVLVDSEDILQAGIEIIAKPPGKQMRSITLLSGGEKCLTSMALLFALFEIKPAAFCLLDEVDAPLDEANVDRLTDCLRQFTKVTQFIVITHNKRTMSIADRLFGISMEEKGVSTVLPLQLSQEPAHRA